MKRTLIVVALTGLLAGCASEWTAEEKLEAFDQYMCETVDGMSVGQLKSSVIQANDPSMNELARGYQMIQMETDPAQCSGSAYNSYKDTKWEKFGKEWTQEDAEEKGYYPLD